MRFGISTMDGILLKSLRTRRPHAFFFPAEDGIRGFHVTGVQTCALPICAIRAWEAIAPRSELGVDVVQTGQTPLIGRDQELTLLLNTAQRVRDAREPQLVTLIGRLETKGPLRFNQPKLRLHLRLPRSLPTAATRAGEP